MAAFELFDSERKCVLCVNSNQTMTAEYWRIMMAPIATITFAAVDAITKMKNDVTETENAAAVTGAIVETGGVVAIDEAGGTDNVDVVAVVEAAAAVVEVVVVAVVDVAVVDVVAVFDDAVAVKTIKTGLTAKTVMDDWAENLQAGEILEQVFARFPAPAAMLSQKPFSDGSCVPLSRLSLHLL